MDEKRVRHAIQIVFGEHLPEHYSKEIEDKIIAYSKRLSEEDRKKIDTNF